MQQFAKPVVVEEPSAHQTPGAEKSEALPGGYRKPRVLKIGTANSLVRNSIDGHLRDYSGSWYVWGS